MWLGFMALYLLVDVYCLYWLLGACAAACSDSHSPCSRDSTAAFQASADLQRIVIVRVDSSSPSW